jgi:hypothetical protein
MTVQVPLQSGSRYPAMGGRQIANVLGQNKGKQERPSKCPEVKEYQHSPLSKAEAPRAVGCPAALSRDALKFPVEKDIAYSQLESVTMDQNLFSINP